MFDNCSLLGENYIQNLKRAFPVQLVVRNKVNYVTTQLK